MDAAQQDGPAPSLIQRNMIPLSVEVSTDQDQPVPNDLVWFVDCRYQNGSVRRSGPFRQEVAARCRAVLAQAFALEWERDASRRGEPAE